MTGFQIVPMEAGHIKELARLEREIFSDPWSEEGFREELTNPLAVFLVALREGEIAGYVGMHHVLDEGYIANLAVSGQFRRQGIASLLLDGIFSYARENSLSLVTLEVRCSNEPAITLYEKYGFVKLGVRKNFYSHPREDAFVMTCFLE